MVSIHLDVEYYNDGHQKMLEATRFAHQLHTLKEAGLNVEDTEIQIYSIFREQGDEEGFRNFNELREKLPSRIIKILDYFDFSKGSIIAKKKLTSETDAMGVGCALSLMSNVAGLSEADWAIIPEGKKKTLDYSCPTASTGTEFVQVEAKGSIVLDTSKKTGFGGSVSAQKASVEKKKIQQRASFNQGVMFGVITTFPTNPHQHAKSYLLDPPIEKMKFEPRIYKLFARQAFYIKELRRISQMFFAIELEANLNRLIKSVQAEKLENIPLFKQDDLRFDRNLRYTDIVSDGARNIGLGRFVRIDEHRCAFIGLRFDILELLRGQDHSRIIAYGNEVGRQERLFSLTNVSRGVLRTKEEAFSTDLYENSAGRLFALFNR